MREESEMEDAGLWSGSRGICGLWSGSRGIWGLWSWSRGVCGLILLIGNLAQSTTVTASEEHNTEIISSEKMLIRELMANYDRVGRNGRPVVNISSSVPVRFGLGLIQMDLDERHNMLAMSTWTRYTWRDEYLIWNPKDYGNITQIRLAPDLLWIPDIMLYNTPLVSGTIKDADLDLASRHALCVITHRGRVSWYPHTLFRSSCSVEITNFPFDEQACSMWFGSWTYNSRELNLQMAFPGGIDLSTFQSDYKESCAWHITNVTSERKIMPANDTDPNFIVLSFDMKFSRKMVFSSYILTLPCVFLACLTMVVFWLPPERPDRTSLAMSIFSSFMVLLLILVEAAPPTASSIPTLGVYYCFNMVLIMFSVILSSMMVNINRESLSGKKVPAWLYCIVGKGIATILFLRKDAPKVKKPLKLVSESEEKAGGETQQRMLGIMSDCPGERFTNGGPQSPTGDTECHAHSLDLQMRQLRHAVGRIEGKVNLDGDNQQERTLSTKQWKYVALVLDRFFSILYFFIIVLSLLTLFPRPL